MTESECYQAAFVYHLKFTHVEKGGKYRVDYITPDGQSEDDKNEWHGRQRRVFYTRLSDSRSFDRPLSRFLSRFKIYDK